MRVYLLIFLSLYVSTVLSHEPKIVSAKGSDAIPFPGHQTYLLSDESTTPSEVAILELDVPARTFGAPPHVHANEDEHFYVLEGEVEFLSGEETQLVKQGGLVVLPRGHLHGFWNRSEQPAKLLLVVSPGRFASFFDLVVSEIRKQNPTNPELVGKIIAEQASRFGVTVMPEKTPASAIELIR